jgi:hypothetical protein
MFFASKRPRPIRTFVFVAAILKFRARRATSTQVRPREQHKHGAVARPSSWNYFRAALVKQTIFFANILRQVQLS